MSNKISLSRDRQHLKHSDGKRMTEMSIRRHNHVLLVAEQVGARNVMQLRVDPKQQVAFVV